MSRAIEAFLAKIRSVMEKIEVHFVHGFLGKPIDWAPVIKSMPQSPHLQFVFHNLVELYKGLDQDKSLFAVGQRLSLNLTKSQSKKIVIGYSLGGRVLLHLLPNCYHKMLLIGTHPGLLSGVEERRKRDQEWAQKGFELSQKEWLQLWDQQKIFENDKTRPVRNFSQETFKTWLSIIEDWSLASQPDKRQYMSDNSENIYWSCGEADRKFVSLASEIAKVLPKTHISLVEGAGHGVVFDQPMALTNKISEVVASA